MMKKIIEQLGVKINALELQAKIAKEQMKEKDSKIKKYKDIALKTPGRQSVTRMGSVRSFSRPSTMKHP